jgi:hypothetical protein
MGPMAIITDRNLVFTRPLLLDAARIKGELLFGLCHPGASKDRAEVSTRKFAPELLFSPTT